MKNLTLALVATLLMTTPSFATVQEPIPLPEISTSGDDGLILGVVVLGILAIILLNQPDEPVTTLVPPDDCFAKNGGAIVCPDR